MSVGSSKASFKLLAGDSSGDGRSLSLRRFPDPIIESGADNGRPSRRKRKSKKKKKKASVQLEADDLPGSNPEEMPFSVTEFGSAVESSCQEPEMESSQLSFVTHVELRQRKLNGTVLGEMESEESRILRSGFDAQKSYYSGDEESSCQNGMKLTASENRSIVESVEFERSNISCISHVELMQKSGNISVVDDTSEDYSSTKESSTAQWKPEFNGSLTKLVTVESLDWKEVLAKDPNLLGELPYAENSPLKYFMGEIYGGSSLRSTISVGNDKKRQGVYNTMFHVPLRCERLIVAGFFVCLDSFLSLLTIMPARILMTIWRVLKTRKFQKPNAAELSDLGCFIVLASGVTTLQLTDISLIYHIIRGQGTFKLYVVYNVLELFDKLCQSFGEDILQVLFNSAEGLANCTSDNVTFEGIRFIFDEMIAVFAFIVHSFILLAQAITLSTCIIAHNNALLALLVSNNFSEIKSNVFKRVSKENLHTLVYYDIIERFHIAAFVVFVLAQNILEAEGPWFGSFLTNALMVNICEMFVDMIKHSFLAKFNEIKPVAYSEFLEDLCKQILNEKPEDRRKNLTFIPLAPACVVIRVLTPIYAALLPHGPLPWRILWIFIWSSLTFVMLAVCKILVGLSLRRLASLYLRQRLRSKQHAD